MGSPRSTSKDQGTREVHADIDLARGNRPGDRGRAVLLYVLYVGEALASEQLLGDELRSFTHGEASARA